MLVFSELNKITIVEVRTLLSNTLARFEVWTSFMVTPGEMDIRALGPDGSETLNFFGGDRV